MKQAKEQLDKVKLSKFDILMVSYGVLAYPNVKLTGNLRSGGCGIAADGAGRAPPRRAAAVRATPPTVTTTTTMMMRSTSAFRTESVPAGGEEEEETSRLEGAFVIAADPKLSDRGGIDATQ